MKPAAIHQYAPRCRPGDDTFASILLIQRLLHKAGIDSEIYSQQVDAELATSVHHFDSYQSHPEQLLLIHHSGLNSVQEQLATLDERCFLVLHSWPPPNLISASDPLRAQLSEAQHQLEQWQTWLTGAIGDCHENLLSLLDNHYSAEQSCHLPLIAEISPIAPGDTAQRFRPVEHPLQLVNADPVSCWANQRGLIETLYHLSQLCSCEVQLVLLGSHEDLEYLAQCREYAASLGLEDRVTFTPATQGQQADHYLQADCYISLANRGYGLPALQALACQLPVLAYQGPLNQIGQTLDGAGLLLSSDDSASCAAATLQLLENPRLRSQLGQLAKQRLAALQPEALYQGLQAFFSQFDIALPEAAPALAQSSIQYCIEGPFDSSYSLALVNRELALALERRHPGQVALHSTEGPGDFLPDPEFLSANPECQALYQRGLQAQTCNHSLRLTYPPRATGMKGLSNGLGCYGWEESALPWPFVQSFNHQLQFATSMSRYVSRTLLDNGVNVPIYTTGIGADHILKAPVDNRSLPEFKAGFKLLHISSCFARKGVDCLLSAYASAFNGSDDVSLIIKTFPNPHHNIEQQLEQWREKLTNPPHVCLINQDLSDGAIRALYQSADLLVAPSRGEGYGLPMAEAMLHDLPVITTGFGGQTDFCTEHTSWPIDYRFERARSHMGQMASVWAEPDQAHLTQLLKEHYSAYQQQSYSQFTQARTEAARELIQSQHSWDTVALRVDQALQQQAELPALNPELKLGCVTTWHTKCGIAAYSKLLLANALKGSTVFANYDDQLTEPDGYSVRRCWQLGQQDDLQQLLQAVLDSGIEVLLIQFNFAFFKLATLRRLLEQLHQQGIKTLITFHSTADVEENGELLSLRTLLPELQQCSRVLVHGTQDLNRLKDWGVIDNCMLLPHGVERHDMAALKPVERPQQLVDKRVIASYGFMLPHKGIRKLILGFAQMHRRNPQQHLLLVNAQYPGSISEQETQQCLALIDRLGIAEQVTLISDFLTDQQSLSWLSMADCILFPYQNTQESSSAAVRWGLAAERPVLCTKLGIFEDVADAVYFLPGKRPEQIAEGINALLGDSERLSELAERQRQWLIQHDWKRISERLKNLCSALLREPQ